MEIPRYSVVSPSHTIIHMLGAWSIIRHSPTVCRNRDPLEAEVIEVELSVVVCFIFSPVNF